MEESVGFEPTVLTHIWFQTRDNKPLWQLSVFYYGRGSRTRTHAYHAQNVMPLPTWRYPNNGANGRIWTCDPLDPNQMRWPDCATFTNFGCEDWARTSDLRVNSSLLYQLSYDTTYKNGEQDRTRTYDRWIWHTPRESNPAIEIWNLHRLPWNIGVYLFRKCSINMFVFLWATITSSRILMYYLLTVNT